MFADAAKFYFPHLPKLQQDDYADLCRGYGEDHTFGRAVRMGAAEPCRIQYQLACFIWIWREEPHFSQILPGVAIDVEANWAGKVKCGVFYPTSKPDGEPGSESHTSGCGTHASNRRTWALTAAPYGRDSETGARILHCS